MGSRARPFIVWFIFSFLFFIFGTPGHIGNLCAWRGWLKVSDWGAQQWISGGLILGLTIILGVYLWLQTIKEGNQQSSKPKVIPIKYGQDDRGYEGLFFENMGDAPAREVTIEPLRMGYRTVLFGGPEVALLKEGETCFFTLDSVSPTDLLEGIQFSMFFSKILRTWQTEIDDVGAKAEGQIQYKDLHDREYEMRYEIGADVLSDNGLVVKPICLGPKLKGKP